MNTFVKGMLLLSVMLFAGCLETGKEKTLTQLDTDTQKFSYALGMDIAGNIGNMPDVDIAALIQGLQDSQAGGETLLADADVAMILDEGMKVRQEAAAQKAKEEAMKYMEENGKRAEVTTTASGLQYEVIVPAEGPKPIATSNVTVHYTGTLTDGTKFDSSRDRGEPISFPLNGVIKGWTEGLQLMSPGAQYRFVIPSDLGYGERGAGGVIPPGATLIFDVELLSFK